MSSTPATGSAEPPTATPAPLLPPEYWTQLGMVNVDGDTDEESDSALGDDKLSSTASISSSILKYRTIQGRTYHSEIGNASYWGTNDERHSESLDIFDVADRFPDATVVGSDISPIQPTWVPPNVKFEMEDCTRDWTFPEDDFDFVHIRYLAGSVADWHEFFRQAYRVTKQGGYLESYEGSPHIYSDDNTMPADSAIAQWGPLFINGGKIIGRSFTVVDDAVQRRAMEAAGYVDIQEKLVKVPSGPWPADPRLKEIGLYAQHAVDSDIEGFILFFTNVQQWSREQVQVYIAHLRKELRSLKHHVYYYQKVVWGRKPFPGEHVKAKTAEKAEGVPAITPEGAEVKIDKKEKAKEKAEKKGKDVAADENTGDTTEAKAPASEPTT
ncbi:methyltransferase domain-containing protein [Ophiostoma piceae UAMH 11346]|uniref:Methyltransferase domain-containing protein n=1 Tax=Ophiostoma piceae (strain UAMH 11346) TaxID=1262450 RepID=S3C290_OPHP1|nr:methyltransferase domain-containing protein [Ophiostoma piceae UAMH 11346]